MARFLIWALILFFLNCPAIFAQPVSNNEFSKSSSDPSLIGKSFTVNIPARTYPLTLANLQENIPEGLSAEAYYDLGIRYKIGGLIEQARECLNRAIKADPNAKVGLKANLMLKTQIPCHPVFKEAVEMNITGFNQNFSGQTEEAKKTFEKCIEKYPEFEWPYSNLGSIYLQEGNIVKAMGLLQKALSINPYYRNALIHLAFAKYKEKDFVGAHQCLAKILEVDPDDFIAQEMRQELDKDNTLTEGLQQLINLPAGVNKIAGIDRIMNGATPTRTVRPPLETKTDKLKLYAVKNIGGDESEKIEARWPANCSLPQSSLEDPAVLAKVSEWRNWYENLCKPLAGLGSNVPTSERICLKVTINNNRHLMVGSTSPIRNLNEATQKYLNQLMQKLRTLDHSETLAFPDHSTQYVDINLFVEGNKQQISLSSNQQILYLDKN